MILKKFKNAFNMLRQGRIDSFLHAVSWSVPRWLFYYSHSYLIYSEAPVWKHYKSKDYIPRPVVLDDYNMLKRDGYTMEKISSRLESGDKGVLIEGESEALTLVWGGLGRKYLELSGAIFDPGKDGFIWYGAYTHEKARMQGLFYIASEYLYDKFLSEGVSKVWGAVIANNAPWLHKLLTGMNFAIVGETFYIKLFCVNICYYKTWPTPVKKIHLFFKNPPDNLKCV